ncbi:MAG: hypothetical protein SF187_03595 [Deltaproteobacteria bacterium]|nr:hypothetical protein [Deltaproteobacteria bacterium]
MSVRIRSLCLMLTLVAACGDEVEETSPDASVADAAPSTSDTAVAGDAGATDAGALRDGEAADAAPVVIFEPRGLVVVHSDYQSASVSLTSLDGTKRLDDCINSGVTSPKLTAALTGDVVLPSMPVPSGEVALIDRKNAAITFLDPATCDVKRQIKVSTNFDGNPYDLLWVAPDRAYVTRYNPNPTPTPAPGDYDDGNDVLIINPITGALTGSITMTPWAVPADKPLPILPRPDRMVAAGGKVYVSLNNLSANYQAAGQGRVVIIDQATNGVEGFIDLPGVNNCSEMQLASGNTLAIACGGIFAAGDKQIDAAGVMLVNLSTKAVTKVASAKFGRTLSLYSLAANNDRYFVVTNGDFSGTPPDQLWTGTFAGEAPASKFTASEAFSLGTMLVHPTLPRLYVADAQVKNSAPQVRVFDTSAAPALTQAPALTVGATKALPVRHIAWY